MFYLIVIVILAMWIFYLLRRLDLTNELLEEEIKENINLIKYIEENDINAKTCKNTRKSNIGV